MDCYFILTLYFLYDLKMISIFVRLSKKKIIDIYLKKSNKFINNHTADNIIKLNNIFVFFSIYFVF